MALDCGELAARHERCFAKHRTIIAFEHARRSAELRPDRIGDSHLQEMLGLLALDELLDEESAGERERRPLRWSGRRLLSGS